MRVVDVVKLDDPLIADEVLVIEGLRIASAPLEQRAFGTALSGATAAHRTPAFPFIQARNDLDALRAHLNSYRDQPHALRVYTKELERFRCRGCLSAASR